MGKKANGAMLLAVGIMVAGGTSGKTRTADTQQNIGSAGDVGVSVIHTGGQLATEVIAVAKPIVGQVAGAVGGATSATTVAPTATTAAPGAK